MIVRDTARVLPVDPSGRVLLLHGWDPARPDEPYWFTVGGGTDEGETLVDAARRELREETGIEVDLSELGEPIARSTIEFGFDGRRYRNHQTFFAVAVDTDEISFDGHDEVERGSIDRHGWFAADELTGHRVHADIPDLIRLAATTVSGRGPS